ncbi:hypothetical protein ACFWIB_15285 [Streptomyces sp. NPDC127051]|uniref:hypothetical protein n=1 Tax=Streptomyces sp. NPDC127051 TaxID=3347119 RepID=UPI00365D4E3E
MTIARQETAERGKVSARKDLMRRHRELVVAEERLQLSLIAARKAGLSLRELSALSGRSTEAVRKATRINGDSRTEAEREATP